MPLPMSRSPKSVGSTHKAPSRPLRNITFILAAFGVAYVLLSSLGGPRASSDVLSTGSKYGNIAANLPDTPAWMKLSSYGGAGGATGTPRNKHRTPKPRAAFVSLVRESNLDALLQTMRDMQWAFNDDVETNYDYILFSEAPFTPWFRDHINNFLAQYPNQPKAHFGLVPAKDWDPPAGVDFGALWHRWMRLNGGRIPYALSRSYRQMCRFYSGALYHQPLMQNIDYYWRIEPETKHTCRYASHWRKDKQGKLEWIERDPFRYMRDNKKKYAFTISLMEYKSTVRSLMAHVNFWRTANPHFIHKNNLLSFVSDNGDSYNRCHFWSNFEIADLSFFRSEAYQSYYKALEKAGGFFIERWGDAPVHSIAASLLLDKDEIWHIDHAGYYHPPYSTCPFDQDPGSQCGCDPQVSIEYEPSLASCQYKFDLAQGRDPSAIVRAINGRNGFFDSKGQNVSARLNDGVPVYEIPTRLMRKTEWKPVEAAAASTPVVKAEAAKAVPADDVVPNTNRCFNRSATALETAKSCTIAIDITPSERC